MGNKEDDEKGERGRRAEEQGRVDDGGMETAVHTQVETKRPGRSRQSNVRLPRRNSIKKKHGLQNQKGLL